jgi:hypothetical protein
LKGKHEELLKCEVLGFVELCWRLVGIIEEHRATDIAPFWIGISGT